MLVLSRKESQRIRLGDSIVLTIVKVAGDKVRVGIQAPSDVVVLRDELETWDDETRAAVQSTAGQSSVESKPEAAAAAA